MCVGRRTRERTHEAPFLQDLGGEPARGLAAVGVQDHPLGMRSPSFMQIQLRSHIPNGQHTPPQAVKNLDWASNKHTK